MLAQGQVFSGVQPSPDGSSVLFRVTLDTPGRNGLFVVAAQDGAVTPLPVFGSARWQDDTRVLVVPFEPGAAAHRLVGVDVTTGSTGELLSLGDKIANDDWQVSPDGTRVVYLSARERALRVPTLPSGPLGRGRGPPPGPG